MLAIAARSREEEARLRARGTGVKRHRLKLAGETVGELRIRWHQDAPADTGLLDLTAALIALELERSRSGEWADEDRATVLVEAVLTREIIGNEEIADRAGELGLDLEQGGGVIIIRLEADDERNDAPAGTPSDHGQRAQTTGLRALRTGGRSALAALKEDGSRTEIQAVVAAAGSDQLEKAAGAVQTELATTVGREIARLTVGYSRHVDEPAELFRAGREAFLALNVAEAEGEELLGFEATGSYRLLLSAISENPAELEWFYEDTIAPLIAYDRQYGTDLVGTVETFLKNDGNIAPTAEALFTHRHTVRYRLGRVHDLSGHDIQTTDGRERLGFGLKAMRALGLGDRSG